MTSADSLVVDLPGGSGNSIALGILSNKFLLDLELSAAEVSGEGEVVARPKVITADKQAATISQGQQVPYLERAGGDAGAAGGATVAFIAAELVLNVTPQITPDDRIILDLDVTQDEVGAAPAGGGAPPINTSNLTTKVLVNNGDTIVLGGVFKTSDTNSINKTPLLGDLPYLGSLFRSTNRTTTKTELLIFITPILLDDPLTNR